jgi:hypothetical protein
MELMIALALLLQAAEPPARAPELSGRITSVIPDGPSALLCLRTNGGTLPNRPAEGLIYLIPESKVTYHDIPLTQQKPAEGMLIEAWLRSGSRDRVEFARLARDEKALPKRSAPPPPPPPVVAAPPPAPPKPPPPPSPPAPAVKPAAAAVVVEAEEMNLRDVVALDLPGAGKGKAIHFTKPGSRAKAMVDLKKGAYEIQVFMQGRQKTREAVTVRLAGREYRLSQDKKDTLAPGVPRDKPRAEIEIPKDEDYELRIEFAEADVLVDRVVFVPIAR